MDPHVYPDPQVAPLRLPAPIGVVAPTFTPIEQLAAPDPTTPWVLSKTMFIRIAMSGPACASVTDPAAPSIYLRADTGTAMLLAGNQTVSIYRRPGADPADYVGDGIITLEWAAGINVFRVAVTFNDAAGTFSWQLGIRNNDAAAPRQFTWVVSGTVENTLQPWINVEPAILSLEVPVNESQAGSGQISNKGTGPFTVSGVSPALPAGFVLGALPAGALNPGASAPLTVTFTAPAVPPSPNGVVTATGIVNVTPPDNTALTVGAGHNKQLSISAKVLPSVRIGGVRADGTDTDFFSQVGGTVTGNEVGNIMLGVASWEP
jgi:hypothetical protein